MAKKSRVLIVGCGGIGGVLAHHLARRSDVELHVVSRNSEITTTIQQTGLHLRGTEDGGAAEVPISTRIPETSFDFVLLATQPPAVVAAAQEAAGHLRSQGAVVVLQNGLCEDAVAAEVGRERVLGGIVTFGASAAEPGVVTRTSRGGIILGSLVGPEDSRMHHLASLLSTVGPITTTPNLIGARFAKLALNCAVSTLGTVAGTSLGALLMSATARNLALEIMRETLRVARADGVVIEDVVGPLRMQWLADPDAPAEGVGHWCRHGLLLMVGLKYRRLRSSMLRAIERGRPPAVGFLNGEVVNRGLRLGVPTPTNAAAIEAVDAIAGGRAQPSMALLRGLAGQQPIEVNA